MSRGPTQADLLAEIALEQGELFHASDGTAYASVMVGEHRETHAIGRRGFRQWLVREFYSKYRKAPNTQAIAAAVVVIEGHARYDGSEQAVALRVGERDGVIYLDLGTADWSAVEISAFGWRLVAEPLLRFRRSAGMLALPVPAPSGSITDIEMFTNFEGEDDFRLFVAALQAALRPRGPYPVLVLQGEQGSAKSTKARVFKALIDPNSAPLRSSPRDERDLMIAATNSHVLAFDNLSRLKPWLSDALCRIATGGGFATRQLYTDADEMLFDAQRPILLNGIDDLAVRDDLRDRAVVLTLPPIPDTKRQDEETFWAAFEASRPAVLGALLDGVSTALANVITVKLDAPPRMADFAIWAYAGAPKYGWSGDDFLKAYTGNRTDAVALTIEASPVGREVIKYIETRSDWEGTATELLKVLNGNGATPSADWPSSPEAMANQLRRVSPALRTVGVDVRFHRGGRRRLITLTKQARNEPSQPSQLSFQGADPAQAGDGCDGGVTVVTVG